MAQQTSTDSDERQTRADDADRRKYAGIAEGAAGAEGDKNVRINGESVGRRQPSWDGTLSASCNHAIPIKPQV